MKRWVLVVAFAGCGEDEPVCTEASKFRGPAVACPGGYCVAEGQNVVCRQACAADSPVCDVTANLWWYTLAVDSGHICWCAPSPLESGE